MKILLINPPNCGRSIPEEKYGIDSIKQIFRGEPLSLEVLAGNLPGHQVRIIDLKVEPERLEDELTGFRPDLAGITAVTCEANTAVRIAATVKKRCGAAVAVGGIHASCDPEFFNREPVDYVAVGLGRASFSELASALEQGDQSKARTVPGIAPTAPGRRLAYRQRRYTGEDVTGKMPPRYDLVERYRDTYVMKPLNRRMGFVSTAFGCTFNCSFCCISSLTGRRYLTIPPDAVLRDIGQLGEISIIRLLDANTFGDPSQARSLCAAIREAGIDKQFLADVRADMVVRHPGLMREWKEAGLRAVVIGFEEISDEALNRFDKATRVEVNSEAIGILHEIGITVIGDFIVSPDYDEDQFDALGKYIIENKVDLPIPSVLTPLPGTRLYGEMKDDIIVHDLDYYTFTNAVTPTKLSEQRFYERYAELLKQSHQGARL